MKEKVINSLSEYLALSKEEISSLLEIPPSSELGDYSFPCFTLAKSLKKSPTEIALDLSRKISLPYLEKVEAKGPYLNFFINPSLLAKETISSILKQKDKYGSSKDKKEAIMIEFSQPNTHKAFHVGHIRGTSLGESISRIMEFMGKKAIRANYSGDTGMHIAKWIWCYQKYHSNEKLSPNESWIAGIYVDAVKRLAEDENYQAEVEEINRKLELKNDRKINELWKKTKALSIKSWDRIYKELNTFFDIHFFESEVELEGKNIALQLLKEGIAKKSEDAIIMDLNSYNLGTWVLLRRDGTVLYSAKDLALARKKIKDFPSNRYLVMVADEQKLHFQQLLKTLELMKMPQSEAYSFLTFGLVRLPTGKMSSRTGDNILYSDFINEVTSCAREEIKKREQLSEKELEKRTLSIAIASIKYAMLKQDSNRIIIFDKNEAINFEGNTGPYLLYSYARAKSILRKAKYNSKAKLKINNVSKAEKSLISQLSAFPEIAFQSYKSLAPNMIANYAFQLSQLFNEFYHAERVIGSENEQFKLALVDAFSQVLKNSLNLLGIDALERM